MSIHAFGRMIDALMPARVDGNFSWVRVGSPNDGGYVVARPGDRKPEGLLSFGGGENMEFERDAAMQGIDVFCIDPAHREDAESNPGMVRGELGREWHRGTVNAWRMLHDSAWLKIDCEGAEWDFFTSMPSAELARFDQIVVEFHGLAWGGWEQKAEALGRLRQRHALVHLHANNYGGERRRYRCRVPDTVECTYLLRELAGKDAPGRWRRSPLDAPNNPRRREIDAGELVAGWRAWLESTY